MVTVVWCVVLFEVFELLEGKVFAVERWSLLWLLVSVDDEKKVRIKLGGKPSCIDYRKGICVNVTFYGLGDLMLTKFSNTRVE